MILLSALLGPRCRAAKLSTYESGMPLLDASRKRISIRFFVVAMVFILSTSRSRFSILALVFRDGGLPLLVEMVVFLGVLAIGYTYIWRKGAFDF